MFKVTRQQVIDNASRMLGLPFLHQGRSLETGVDCVGLLVVMGQLIGYPDIKDVEGYRRIPSAETIRSVLSQNLIEIPLTEMGVGDVFLMRMGGIKPRHTAILFSNTVDYPNGKEPQLLHATKNGVILEAKRMYPSSWFVSGYRLRGLVE